MDAAGTRTTLHMFVEAPPSTCPSPGPCWVVRNDGSPIGHLFEGADGSVYGTTYTLVKYLYIPVLPAGQVFRIGPDGTFTRLASARGLQAGVIQARDGRLYGVMTRDPWAGNVGRVFRVEANGTLTTLHTFGTASGDPIGELVEIDDGSLYGATAGTVQASATIFQVDPATGAFATRYSFTDGITPAGRLIQVPMVSSTEPRSTVAPWGWARSSRSTPRAH